MKYLVMQYRRTLPEAKELLWPTTIFLTLLLIVARSWVIHGHF